MYDQIRFWSDNTFIWSDIVPELKIRIYKCTDTMSVHYQFTFKFYSDISTITACSATRLVVELQFAADLTNSTPDHQI